MKIDANGAMGETGVGRDFRSGHAFNQAKNQSFAVSVGKRTNGVEDCPGFCAGVRGLTRGREVLFCLRGNGFFVEFGARFGAAVKIGRAIAGDGSEPSGETGDFAESGEAGQGLEEDILYEIVDIGERNPSEENAVDHAGIAGVEEAEGGAITLLSGPDEGVVGAAGFVDNVHGRGTGAGRAEF